MVALHLKDFMIVIKKQHNNLNVYALIS